MEWLIIPGIVLGLCLMWFGLYVRLHWDDAGLFGAIVLAILLLIFAIACPINYYGSRAESARVVNFYENIIVPHIVEEGDDYVVVEGLEAGIWQAGSITDFNSALRNNHYWDDIPLIGSVYYRFPSNIKYVRLK